MKGYLLIAFVLNIFRLIYSILEELPINNFLQFVLLVLHFVVSVLQYIPRIDNYFTDVIIEIIVLSLR